MSSPSNKNIEMKLRHYLKICSSGVESDIRTRVSGNLKRSYNIVDPNNDEVKFASF